MDAIVIFEDVLVPWDRVFLLGDVELCNNAFAATNAVVHMMHQVVTKNVAKSEFVVGLASMMVETLGSGQVPQVRERVAELIMDLEVMRACLRASEADAALDEWGVMCPNRPPLDVARNLFPRMYPRMIEILQLLGSSNLMAIPTEADFDSDVAADLDHYLGTEDATGRDRVRLFRLAWDVACSAFGSRQVLYERFFFGDPSRMASALYDTYDREPLMARVREPLTLLTGHRETPPGAPLMRYRDLADLQVALHGIRDGTLEGDGILPRAFRVNAQLMLYTDFPWAERWE